MDILIVTGMSGAGKKTVGHMLEDMGYFCVDNMPLSLMGAFFDIYGKNPEKKRKIAFTLDIRGGYDLKELLDVVDQIKSNPECSTCRILFLDCSDGVIINRYKESRHIHPLLLAKELSLEDAIKLERSMVGSVAAHADFVINTDDLRPTELKAKLENLLEVKHSDDFIVNCSSFGHKYGAPRDLDIMLDVRCFPNPYYIPELKNHTGLEKCITDYVFSSEETKVFLQKLFDMLDFLLPLYKAEGKSYLSIGIGCTGGKHRSVAITEALAAHLRTVDGIYPVVIHRDISK